LLCSLHTWYRMYNEYMHELNVTRDILRVVLEYASLNAVSKVLRIYLEVPSFSDFEDIWLQRYFTLLSKGTIAEHAELSISRIPSTFHCITCSYDFPVTLAEVQSIRCPRCYSQSCELISTGDYFIKNMEAV
jgi:hydrogenase nickel incorporation protein HypA/HybF